MSYLFFDALMLRYSKLNTSRGSQGPNLKHLAHLRFFKVICVLEMITCFNCEGNMAKKVLWKVFKGMWSLLIYGLSSFHYETSLPVPSSGSMTDGDDDIRLVCNHNIFCASDFYSKTHNNMRKITLKIHLFTNTK